MKTYVKPELEIREISVIENLAKLTPAGAKLSWLRGQAPTTVYSLGLYGDSGAQPAAVDLDEDDDV